jgi:DNA repair photolyase
MIIREIKAKNILSKSGLPGIDFAINPYVGCLHGCVYCYARFMKKFTNHPEPWGQFCDARINASELLAKEIKKIPADSTIFLSSVTDPYGPPERKYCLTRKILEILADYDFNVDILTKSDLVLRDLDILKRIKNLEVGLTITALGEKIQRLIEPEAAAPQKRLEALEILKKSGIPTYAFVGPILPHFTDLEKIFAALQDKAGYILADTLNTKGQNWFGVANVLKKHFPALLEKYRNIYFVAKNLKNYEKNLREEVKNLSRKYQIPVKIVF